MQEGFVKQYKRRYYIQALYELGVSQIDGKALMDASDRELKFALAMARAKQQ